MKHKLEKLEDIKEELYMYFFFNCQQFGGEKNRIFFNTESNARIISVNISRFCSGRSSSDAKDIYSQVNVEKLLRFFYFFFRVVMFQFIKILELLLVCSYILLV